VPSFPFFPSRPGLKGPTNALALPATPNSPSPANAGAATMPATLSWVAAGATSFDVYFDTVNPPLKVVSSQATASYAVKYSDTIGPGTYYWKIVAKNATGNTTGPVWSFALNANATDPEALTASSVNLLYDKPIELTTDAAQLRTRVYCKGAGSTVAAAAAPGDTSLQVASLGDTPTAPQGFFGPGPGTVIVNSQRIKYTGISIGFAPAPSAGGGSRFNAAADDTVDGTIIGMVWYQVTSIGPNGESSPTQAVQAVAHQVTIPGSFTATAQAGGSMTQNVQYTYALTYTTGSHEADSPGGANQASVQMGSNGTVALTNLQTSSDPRVTGRKLYRKQSAQADTNYKLVTSLDNVVTTYTDSASDASLSGSRPFINSTGSNVVLNNIPLGPPGTTSRRIYRTPTPTTTGSSWQTGGFRATDAVPSAGAYQLIATLSDNKTLTYTDGGGSASTSANQSVSAISPTPLFFLTGVPASGTGSITNPIAIGVAVNIWAQADNLSAQATYGVIEYVVSDSAMVTQAMALLRAQAELTLFSLPIKTLKYSTLDPNVRSGRVVVADLVNPPIVGAFLIQSVDLTQWSDMNGVTQGYEVTASSVRFTLDDLLRKILLGGTIANAGGSSGGGGAATVAAMAPTPAAATPLTSAAIIAAAQAVAVTRPTKRWIGWSEWNTSSFANLAVAPTIESRGWTLGVANTPTGVVDANGYWARQTAADTHEIRWQAENQSPHCQLNQNPHYEWWFRTGSTLQNVRLILALIDNITTNSDNQAARTGVGVVFYNTSRVDTGFMSWYSDGTTQVVGAQIVPIAVNTIYYVVVDVSGSTLTITINGTPVTLAIPSTLSSTTGLFGILQLWNNDGGGGTRTTDLQAIYGERD